MDTINSNTLHSKTVLMTHNKIIVVIVISYLVILVPQLPIIILQKLNLYFISAFKCLSIIFYFTSK